MSAATINSQQAQAIAYNTCVLTREQVAGLLQVSPDYVDQQIKAGRLKAFRPTPKVTRVYLRDLDAFLQANAD